VSLICQFTGFPKRRGVRVMPLLVFACAQRLHGCWPALALSAGHGPHQACKPLGGFHCCSNTATKGGRLLYDSIKVGFAKFVESAKFGFAKFGSVRFVPVRLAPLEGSASVGSAKVGSEKISFTCGVCRQ